MEIDWLEYDRKDHVLAWFLSEVMVDAGIDKFIKGNKLDTSKLNVVITVDGIDVDFIKCMDHLQSQLENIGKTNAENAAHSMVDKLKCQIYDTLSDFDI